MAGLNERGDSMKYAKRPKIVDRDADLIKGGVWINGVLQTTRVWLKKPARKRKR